MLAEKKKVANWGNYPVAECEVVSPATPDDARAWVEQSERILARGNGRCYGDAALGPRLISTLAWKNILHFDPENGVITCEAGVLLDEILRLVLPKGWMFKVTPGTRLITVGGAIASDVHGKNHFHAGCFSDHLLSFDLMRADGQVVVCTPTQNADLFWQTSGGMGWTGVILRATFQLMKIPSGWMRQTTVRGDNLEAVMEQFYRYENSTYMAGWIDCLASGKNLGRGVAFFAEHADEPDLPPAPPIKQMKPDDYWGNLYAPSWMLNRLSIAAHNHFYWSGNKPGEKLVGIDRYFYPLDSFSGWNRFYGRRGLVQYQFCAPEKSALTVIKQVLQTIHSRSERPFLTVLKRHGDRRPEAIHSFPERGFSLALDFPRTSRIFELFKLLDAILLENGGKIYLTKDVASDPGLGKVNPRSFGEDKFYSLQKGRLMGGF